MISRFLKTVSRFRSGKDGNVLIMTGLALPVIMIVGLGSLDSWEMMEQHRKMNVAGEQAAVAALHSDRARWSKRKKIAERIFLVNTEQGTKLSSTKLKMRSWKSEGETFVQVAAKADYKSVFGPLAGGKPKALRTVSLAVKRGNVVRIVDAKKYRRGKFTTD